MYIPLYIPKSVIVAFLLTIGCIAGWMSKGWMEQANSASLGPTVAAAPASTLPQAGQLSQAGQLPQTGQLPPGGELPQRGQLPQATPAGSPPVLSPQQQGGPLAPPVVASAPDGTQRVVVVPARAEPLPPSVVAAPAPVRSQERTPVAAPPTVEQPTLPARAATNSVLLSPNSPMALGIPPFLAEPIFTPLPGAQTRGVSFMEWESYRVDIAGEDISVIVDDSNFMRDRNGPINGNTGDTDASGLNVIDATDSVILGSESADEAPYQTAAAALVDLASGGSAGGDAAGSAAGGSDDDGDADEPDPGDPEGPVASAAAPGSGAPPGASAVAALGDDDEDGDGTDFPYEAWTRAISGSAASAVNTDDGTTLASGADALVIGSDGYDDDDVRVAGRNIYVARDDGNVVLGGAGKVNAQVGDSEQGAVIMGIVRTYVQGGGAY